MTISVESINSLLFKNNIHRFVVIFSLYSYPNFMKDYCPRSCGLCPLVPGTSNVINTLTSKCADKDKRCPAWAAYANQCQSNRLFMSRMCKQTCGLCNSLEDNLSSLQDLPSASSAIFVGLRQCLWLGMGFLVTHFLRNSLCI